MEKQKQKFFIELHLHDKKDEEFTTPEITRDEVFNLKKMKSYRDDSNPRIKIFAVSLNGVQSIDVNLMNEIDYKRRKEK